MLFLDRSSLWACAALGSGLSASLTAMLVVAPLASAQSQLPACPPPASQEYLLLVRGKTEAERSEIASILPADNPVLVCQYRNETLVRAGGFTSLETANAWASYLTTVEGFESFVSKPSGQEVATQPSGSPDTQVGSQTSHQASSQTNSSQTTASSSSAVAYQPSRLASGYAVLVNYGDRPEIAAAVGKIVRPVGLAVYRQQAYLLADYTTNADSAAATLQRLSNAQLTAVLVDAKEVVRLTTEVTH